MLATVMPSAVPRRNETKVQVGQWGQYIRPNANTVGLAFIRLYSYLANMKTRDGQVYGALKMGDR